MNRLGHGQRLPWRTGTADPRRPTGPRAGHIRQRAPDGAARRGAHDRAARPHRSPSEVLADVRDDVLAEDPALADSFADFNTRDVPAWARPGPWCWGSGVASAATIAALRFLGTAALGAVAMLMLLGGLVLVGLAMPSGEDPGAADRARDEPIAR